jgi:uncharacterized membrane protein YeaQ/YmgE (transglycosylase-associated protein family)
MFELIWIILIGAVVGALAKLVMPGPDGGGFWLTAILGIVGAVVATLLGRMVGLYGVGEGAGLIASLIGAIIVLAVHRKFQKRSPTVR